MINMCDIYEAVFSFLAKKFNKMIEARERNQAKEQYDLQLELTEN